ncbi:MAG: hypothetical protein D3909_13710, partial [Candidatus Electrothrix sp. ATG1]|nr:hypothetical protein [Candidatus Electrothrix sp. ATG1]
NESNTGNQCSSGVQITVGQKPNFPWKLFMPVILAAAQQNNTPSPSDSCATGMVPNCALNCLDEVETNGSIGDGYCDDGAYGVDLRCEAFNWDDGDCGI